MPTKCCFFFQTVSTGWVIETGALLKILQVRKENRESDSIIGPERGKNGCSFAGVREVAGPRVPENRSAVEKCQFSVRFYSDLEDIAVAFLFQERSRIFYSVFLIIHNMGHVYD